MGFHSNIKWVSIHEMKLNVILMDLFIFTSLNNFYDQ